jgi:hypothetical protein
MGHGRCGKGQSKMHMAVFVVWLAFQGSRVRDLAFFPGRYCSLSTRDFERLVVKRSQDQDTNTLPLVRRVSGVRACVRVSLCSLAAFLAYAYRLVSSLLLFCCPLLSCPIVLLFHYPTIPVHRHRRLHQYHRRRHCPSPPPTPLP